MIHIQPFIEPSHNGNMTLALDAAVAAALPKAEAVYIPAGWHRFLTPPRPIGGGVTIRGESGLTTAHTGTCLVVQYSEPAPEAGFLTWDGTDPRGYKGTGGGVRDLTIYKYGNFRGGCALVVKPANHTNYRSGMWTLDNVAVISENQGLWDRIFLADGSNIPPNNGNGGDVGIRVVTLKNFFASGANVCTVELRNAVHVSWVGGQVQRGPATTTTPATLKVSGTDSQDLDLRVSVYGLLHLERCKIFDFSGVAIDVQIDASVSRGFVKALQNRSLVNRTHPQDKVIVTAI